jgi:hypothetical protein
MDFSLAEALRDQEQDAEPDVRLPGLSPASRWYTARELKANTHSLKLGSQSQPARSEVPAPHRVVSGRRRPVGRAPRRACNARIRGSRRSRPGARTRARSPGSSDDPDPSNQPLGGHSHPSPERRWRMPAHLRPVRSEPRRRPLEPRFEWRMWAWERSGAIDSVRYGDALQTLRDRERDQLMLFEEVA